MLRSSLVVQSSYKAHASWAVKVRNPDSRGIWTNVTLINMVNSPRVRMESGAHRCGLISVCLFLPETKSNYFAQSPWWWFGCHFFVCFGSLAQRHLPDLRVVLFDWSRENRVVARSHAPSSSHRPGCSSHRLINAQLSIAFFFISIELYNFIVRC